MAVVPFSDRPPVGGGGLVRHVAVIGGAGLASGVLVGGAGARLFMRIAGATGRDAAQGATTEAGFTVGEITAGGSLALIIIVGVLVGMLGAVAYAVFRPWLGWAGRWRGVAFGVVLCAVGSAASDVMNPDNVDFFILGNGPIAVAAIAGMFLVFGAVMELAYSSLDRRVPAGSGRMAVLYSVVVVVGVLLGLPLYAAAVFTESACDCGPPLLPAVFTVVAGLGTALWWLTDQRPSLRAPAALLGYAGLVGATGFGLVRAIEDAAQIVG